MCVCFQGYVFSSASQLIGLEISEEFVQLQKDIVEKYQLTDRIQVPRIHTEYTQHPGSTRAHSGGGLVSSLIFCRFYTLMCVCKKLFCTTLMFSS